MTQSSHRSSPAYDGTDGESGPPDVATIEADIAQHREELADTIDQLSARLDVKSRVRARATQTKADAAAKLSAARTRAKQDKRLVAATVGALVGFVGTAIVVRRRRSRR